MRFRIPLLIMCGAPMNQSKYEILLKCIELGSMSGAAEELGYTQPGLSRVLKSIEDDFGFEIISRTHSGITWNSVGESIAPYLQAVCMSERELQRQIEITRRAQSGLVKIGTFISASIHIVSRVVASLAQTDPELDVIVRVGDYKEIESWLLHGEVDFAVTVAPTKEPMHTFQIAKDEMLCTLPKGHPLEKFEQIPLEEFAKWPQVSYTNGSERDFFNIKNIHLLNKNIRHYSEEDASGLALVENGLAVCLTARMMARYLDFDVSYRSLDPPAFRTIIIAKLPGIELSPPAQRAYKAFLDYTQSGFNTP